MQMEYLRPREKARGIPAANCYRILTNVFPGFCESFLWMLSTDDYAHSTRASNLVLMKIDLTCTEASWKF